MAALNTIYTLGEDMETTSEYHQAQNTLSAALFHEPLNDYFYRINVLTMDGFYLSSRYETIGLLENYSDELRTVMLRLPYLNERNRGLSQKTLVRPHIDPWFVARPISIYTLMSPAVYHGKQIGFVEVNALSTDLFDIFSSNDMAGFRATAYDAGGRLFHRSFDDTIDYSAAEYGSMTECSDKNGDTYYVVKEHCSWLGFDIYAAQRTAVFESSIHSVILHHVLVSLLVLFIAEVFIILSSHQLSRSILRLTRKVAESCEDHDLTDCMVIGTSAIIETEIDGAVGMNSGIFNNPFIIWGKYHKGFWRTTLKLSFQFHHTQMDGAHAGKFLERLQAEVGMGIPDN